MQQSLAAIELSKLEQQRVRLEGQLLTAKGWTALGAFDAHERSSHEDVDVGVDDPQALAVARALDEERAAGGARGDMHGIPVLLKDNIAAEGLHAAAGAAALAGWQPDRDAFLVQQLRDAGAIILGKAIWGGLGQNLFNPALVGRAFLQAAFPSALTTWVAPGGLPMARSPDLTPYQSTATEDPDGTGRYCS